MLNRVPFNDLTRLESDLSNEISIRAGEISISGAYILGPEVLGFEEELANYLQVSECAGVASGTDALILALLALGVGPGDTVMTMANAGSYTTIAAKSVGAEPVFVDVDPNSLQMSLSHLEAALAVVLEFGIKPKVVVVTHLFGQINEEIEEISEFVNRNEIYLVEDCAQTMGAKKNNRRAGSVGALSTFSFYPTKNLGAAGDGGAVAGNDTQLVERVKKLRQYGWSSKYSINFPGGRNSRLDEIQAAILRIKLPYLDSWNQMRRNIYSRYLAAASTKVKFYSKTDESYVAHLVPITVEGMTQRDLSDYFLDLGIQSSIHFPIPDHRQEIDLRHSDLIPLPITEKACSSLVTLPMFPEMHEEEILRVCTSLSELGN